MNEVPTGSDRAGTTRGRRMLRRVVIILVGLFLLAVLLAVAVVPALTQGSM